jgi:hypothetical protein
MERSTGFIFSTSIIGSSAISSKVEALDTKRRRLRDQAVHAAQDELDPIWIIRNRSRPNHAVAVSMASPNLHKFFMVFP